MSLLPPLAVPPPTDGRLDPAVLADIATGLAAARHQWGPAAEQVPVRLLATPTYEAWAVPTHPGAELDLHDHGESAAVLVVLDGELHERSVVDGAFVDDVLVPGRLRWVPPGVVHAVANRGDAPVTTVQVFSPPLSSLTRFDGDGVGLLGVDVVPAAPSFDPADGATFVHPSAGRHGG